MTSPPKRSKSSRLSAKPTRQAGLPVTARPIRQVPLAELEADLARHLRLARTEEIVITRKGKPAGVLVGFKTQDDGRAKQNAGGG